MQQIVEIKYSNYKGFKKFTLTINDFNILVGPNNAGKSTIIGSLKILAEGIRKAKFKKPNYIPNPYDLSVWAYEIDLQQVPVGTENVFHNYNDEEPSEIKFTLNDESSFNIFFPSRGLCYMYYSSNKVTIKNPTDFKKFISLEIGFVPVLGPVEHKERLYQKEAARSALLSYNASRNFRNIWHHYNEDFENFKQLIKSTWAGMDIELPELNTSSEGVFLDMFCPENRIPREIFWAGFGFQVWCQMLTYIVKNKNASLFLIDEPDIYLHSDLQKQLLDILKILGPDIIIATHSTEIISEANINDIILINKKNDGSIRINDNIELIEIYKELGSNLNPTITQIAKTRKVIFVEDKDFHKISKKARLAKYYNISNKYGFAVVSMMKFDLIKIENIKKTIEKSVGVNILSMVILNKQNENSHKLDESYNKFLELHDNTIYCDFKNESEDYENIFIEINKFIEIQNI